MTARTPRAAVPPSGTGAVAVRTGLLSRPMIGWAAGAGLVLVGSVLFFLLATRYFGPGLFDDSWISLRYVRHLVQGDGLVWNRGEPPVEGFTNLGWIVLLAAFDVSARDPLVKLAGALGIALGIATLWMAWAATRVWLTDTPRLLAVIVPLHLACSPLFIRHSVSGMETTAVALCNIGLVWSWGCVRRTSKRRDWIGMAVLVLVAASLRPDSIVFGLTGSAAAWWSARQTGLAPTRTVAPAIIVGAVAAAAFLIWKWFYFGSLVPLPAYMKLSPLRVVSAWKFVAGHWLGFATAVSPLLMIVLVAVLVGTSSWRRLLPVSIAVAAHALYLLWVLPVMSVDFRLWIPVYGPLVILAGVTLAAVATHGGAQGGTSHAGTRPRPWRWCPALLLFVTYELGMLHPVRAETETYYRGHEAYGRVARGLAGLDGVSAAVSEVGQFPYYSDFRVLDLSGLNDPFIARHRFSSPDFPAAFEQYVTRQWGLPDLYFEPPPEYAYARLDTRPSVAALYERHEVLGLTIYVLQRSPRRTSISERLGGLG